MTDHRPAYLAMVKKTLSRLHERRFHRLWQRPTREGEWCGRFQVTQNLAFQFAVLHHFEPNPGHLEPAKKYLLDFDKGFHFTSLFCGRAFELVGKSLTASERQAFARRWVGDVQNQFEQYVLWRVDGKVEAIRGWDNVRNHALCACVYADSARALFPEESRPYGFERVTDRVWEVWWARREFQEQASTYEGFSECFLCAWADLRGVTKEFHRSPSIRNLLERNQRVVSPAGIVTPYGDSDYHEHLTAWIALFEKAGAETGDEGIKGAAWDIFSYTKALGMQEAIAARKKVLQANPYNGRMLYAQYLHTLSWLAMAALWSDPELRPESRTAPAGVNARLPFGYRLKAADRKRLPSKQLVPCQVALTGGPADPQRRSYLLLSIGPKLVHDHADAGAILMLSRGDTTLLGTNGYNESEWVYHHIFYAQRSSWPRFPEDGHGKVLPGDDACKGEIEDLRVGRNTSYCRVRFEAYHGMPLTLHREIVVERGGEVTLLDRVKAQRKGLCGGPLFHAERIHRVSEGVYLLRTDILRSLGGLEFNNPPGRLRVEFVHPESEAEIARLGLPAIYNRPDFRAFPICHYAKVWKRAYTARKCLFTRRDLDPGREIVFVTRLSPENGIR